MLSKIFIGTATEEFQSLLNEFTEKKDKDIRKVEYAFVKGKVIATVYYMPAEWMSIAEDGQSDLGLKS